MLIRELQTARKSLEVITYPVEDRFDQLEMTRLLATFAKQDPCTFRNSHRAALFVTYRK